MFHGVFESKTVLITGNTGFKGTWLSLWLQRLGANVVGYALDPPTEPSLFGAVDLSSTILHVKGDIRDRNKIYRTILEHRPEFIFHLAAQPLVRDSYLKPQLTFEVNVMGTVFLLDSIKEAGFPCVVVAVTSDKVYENREWVYSYRENDRLGGHDPYSASKAAAELVIASYRQSFFPPEMVAQHGVRLASARAGNVIGGGDWSADRIVPDAIRAFTAGVALTVRNPSAIRPWQHVLECLSGYLQLASVMAQPDGERFASAWNFGPAPIEKQTVADVVSKLAEAWGNASWLASVNSNEPIETNLLQVSIERTRTELGWFPVWDIATAVKRSVDCYRSLLTSTTYADSRTACHADIDAYEQQANL